MNQEQLLELKEEINTAKSEVNKLQGRREHLMQQLQEDWDCKSLEQAKKKLEALKAEAQKLGTQIETQVTKLEEKYEFE